MGEGMPEDDERQGRKMGMTDIDDIIARLEAGGLDGRIDPDIHAVIHGYERQEFEEFSAYNGWWFVVDGERQCLHVPRYTMSQDAITEAIVAAGFDYRIQVAEKLNGVKSALAVVALSRLQTWDWDCACEAEISAAAALCIAFLKALKDQENT